MTSPHPYPHPVPHPDRGEHRLSILVRESRGDDADTAAVGELVRDYLRQTESEKFEHGRSHATASSTTLPPHYEREVSDPRAAYADCTTLLACVGTRAAGVVVIRVDGGEAEIKRLWADPELRGRRLGSALLDTALSLATGAVRLTVWEWRTSAIALYESRGFERVESWEAREGLICMVRPAASAPERRSAQNGSVDA